MREEPLTVRIVLHISAARSPFWASLAVCGEHVRSVFCERDAKQHCGNAAAAAAHRRCRLLSPPQGLAEACAAGEDIRINTGEVGLRNQGVKAFNATAGTLALVVVDLQPLFVDACSPWSSPTANAPYRSILPKVLELADAVSNYCGPGGKPAGVVVLRAAFWLAAEEAALIGGGPWL